MLQNLGFHCLLILPNFVEALKALAKFTISIDDGFPIALIIIELVVI